MYFSMILRYRTQITVKCNTLTSRSPKKKKKKILKGTPVVILEPIKEKKSNTKNEEVRFVKTYIK